jgi:hypothetical protein
MQSSSITSLVLTSTVATLALLGVAQLKALAQTQREPQAEQTQTRQDRNARAALDILTAPQGVHTCLARTDDSLKADISRQLHQYDIRILQVEKIAPADVSSNWCQAILQIEQTRLTATWTTITIQGRDYYQTNVR